MMRVQVLLFAGHRELVGESRVEVDVPDGTSAGSLYSMLEEQRPALAALRSSTTFAVNRQVVDPATRLQPDDEVALLQPVSGG